MTKETYLQNQYGALYPLTFYQAENEAGRCWIASDLDDRIIQHLGKDAFVMIGAEPGLSKCLWVMSASKWEAVRHMLCSYPSPQNRCLLANVQEVHLGNHQLCVNDLLMEYLKPGSSRNKEEPSYPTLLYLSGTEEQPHAVLCDCIYTSKPQ